MGIIKEPEGVDFIVGPGRPTESEFKKISEFIKKDKEKRAKALAKKQASNETQLALNSKKSKIKAA